MQKISAFTGITLKHFSDNLAKEKSIITLFETYLMLYGIIFRYSMLRYPAKKNIDRQLIAIKCYFITIL